MRELFEISKEQIDSVKNISYVLLNYVDSFSFVIRKGENISLKTKKLLENLSDYLIEQKTVSKWPGTELLVNKFFPDNFAGIYLYDFNIKTMNILVNTNDKLFQWLAPELPEDLTFYKNSKPILISITHENDAYFELDEDDEKHLRSHNIKLLKKQMRN